MESRLSLNSRKEAVFMKKMYIEPSTELVRVNCSERLAYGELSKDSNIDPYAGARTGNFIDEENNDGEDKPIFERWKNPYWDE
jgi:hypothetical protein